MVNGDWGYYCKTGYFGSNYIIFNNNVFVKTVRMMCLTDF